MLSRVDIIFKGKDINQNMSSALHGYLMSVLDQDYVDYLHHIDLNPYASFLFFDKDLDCYVWRINTFNRLAYQMVIEPMLAMEGQSIFLNQKNRTYDIESIRQYSQTSYEALYLDGNPCYKVRFLSPTSFKSQNKYQIFPRVDFLINSVIRKINKFSDDIKLEDKKVVASIIDSTDITAYNLRSTRFSLESLSLNAFMGWIRLRNFSNEEYKNILYFLLKTMSYTGVGIKTALGMGGVCIE